MKSLGVCKVSLRDLMWSKVDSNEWYLIPKNNLCLKVYKIAG